MEKKSEFKFKLKVGYVQFCWNLFFIWIFILEIHIACHKYEYNTVQFQALETPIICGCKFKIVHHCTYDE